MGAIMSSNNTKQLEGLAKLINIDEIKELEISCLLLLEEFFENLYLLESESASLKLKCVYDYMKDKINIGNWKDVKLYVRKTITIVSFFRLVAFEMKRDFSQKEQYREAFDIIDNGLMFGCPLKSEPQLLQRCAQILTQLSGDFDHGENLDKLIIDIDGIQDETDIDILYCPSMECFYKNYVSKEKPVVLRNCIDHWPAMVKWKDLNYLIEKSGLRTVPVEIGSKYTDKEWTQQLMTVGNFIKKYIANDNETMGYLAQYQLFQHIVELKNDIIEPEYCCFKDTDEPTDINAWFGPKGTVSPLHFDPKRNLLAQVLGAKKVILFAPEDSSCLYPHADEMLLNTARVDPTYPDLDKFPSFRSARPYTCTLKSGDMLYIPPKWWHFVQSLSVSFSVSFWWL